MSKRNFILLIIILVIILIGFFLFLFLRQSGTTPVADNGGTNFVSQFNPFGTGGKNSRTTNPVDISGGGIPQTPAGALKLVKVSTMPIAGYTVFAKERLVDVPVPTVPLLMEEGVGGGDSNQSPPRPAGTPPQKGGEKIKPTPPATEFAPALRYVERATGNIYQTFADKIAERKFSTTVIPKIYEALFGNHGNSVIMRYLKGDQRTVETFVGNLPPEVLGGDTTEDNEVKGSFLPENISDISLSPDTGSLFYIFESGDGIVGDTVNLTTNKKTQVVDSPFTEWLSAWPNSSMITLTTKPASFVPGYMYKVNLGKTGLLQVMGNISGLTTLGSPDGKLVLYTDNNLSLSVYNISTKGSVPLGVRTLPEKCVWGKASDVVYCAVPKFVPPGSYPDSWYQGEVSFADQIWKVDITTGNAALIIDPAIVNGGEEIDGTKLMLDDGGKYLFFVNKKDSFLWELGLVP